MKFLTVICVGILASLGSCSSDQSFIADFDNIHNRTWVGEEFWSIPLEGWKVNEGRLELDSRFPNARVNLLTEVISPGSGDFELSAEMGLLKSVEDKGSAGFLLGIYDDEDADVRAACYFGKSIKAGVSLDGQAFLGSAFAALPADFNWDGFSIKIRGNNHRLTMELYDQAGSEISVLNHDVDSIRGWIALSGNMRLEDQEAGRSQWWYDNLQLGGSKVRAEPDNAFGPILWTTYTLSRNTLKLMVQMPPIGREDNQQVELQLEENGDWENIATESIEPDSRTAIFRIENWDVTKDQPYRVIYANQDLSGKTSDHHWHGTIRKDPVDRPLKMAGLTCQYHYGFPYTPLVKNLEFSDPDLMYFSGDQIYEGNGGYSVIREPADQSILSYLGKYYMFGWAFGNLMRDRPTICTPDDHDVFHGNIWGEGGKLKEKVSDDLAGFVQSVQMVNVVNRTQCGNLPDPYDPTPIKNNMSVWYTDLVYGRVSFAILSDRIFKSGPERVAQWEGRQDHLQAPLKDPSSLHVEGLELLGERQEAFLENWVVDWAGADFKVLLSQTVFANVATHHGGLFQYLYGDLDSGGWPKKKRDKAVELMRKCFAFHINGDQHLPSLVQYGIENYRDAGWSYCPPAISVGYRRAFWPEKLGREIKNRPGHDLPNTGEYTDAFGNKSYVYAVGMPGEQGNWDRRYYQAHKRLSGFGLMSFDHQTRDISIDAYQFLAEIDQPNKAFQFPGWPVTINQLDNYGGETGLYLPTLKVSVPNQVVKVLDSKGDLVYNLRMAGDTFRPKVFRRGSYSIEVGEGDATKMIENVRSGDEGEIIITL